MLVLLDSTVLIDHLRGRPVVERIRRMLAAGDTLTTSALNVEEVVRGMRASEATIVDRLLNGLIVIPVDEAVARLSGQWRSEYSARGVTLHQADCLVAATASVHQARLCTGNPKDFPMLQVDHWPVGT